MKMKRKLLINLLVLSTVFIATISCSWLTDTGQLQEDSTSIPLEGVEEVAVNLRMGAGEMTIGSGSEMLMEADFAYNVSDWEPTIDYSVSGDQGTLFIEQPEVERLGINNYIYEWNLRFNPDVLLDMDINLGAGRSSLDFSQLTVTNLQLQMGAGEVEIDLTGDRQNDLVGSIRGGVGRLTVLLPEDVGVFVSVRGGIGSVDTGTLRQTENGYVNEAMGDSETTITLDIEGGVGEIDLSVVE
jgi:hypothetical protein